MCACVCVCESHVRTQHCKLFVLIDCFLRCQWSRKSSCKSDDPPAMFLTRTPHFCWSVCVNQVVYCVLQKLLCVLWRMKLCSTAWRWPPRKMMCRSLRCLMDHTQSALWEICCLVPPTGSECELPTRPGWDAEQDSVWFSESYSQNILQIYCVLHSTSSCLSGFCFLKLCCQVPQPSKSVSTAIE